MGFLLVLLLMAVLFLADQKIRQHFGLWRVLFHRNPDWRRPKDMGHGEHAPNGYLARRARRRR